MSDDRERPPEKTVEEINQILGDPDLVSFWFRSMRETTGPGGHEHDDKGWTNSKIDPETHEGYYLYSLALAVDNFARRTGWSVDETLGLLSEKMPDVRDTHDAIERDE